MANVSGQKEDLQSSPAGEPEVKVTGGTASGQDNNASTEIIGEEVINAILNAASTLNIGKDVVSGSVTILLALGLCIMAVVEVLGYSPPAWFVGLASAYIGGERFVAWKKK